MLLIQFAAVLLIVVSLLLLALPAPYTHVPVGELKRRAARGDRYAKALAGPAAHGDELQLLVFVVAIVCLAAGLFLLGRAIPTPVLPLALAVALGLAFWVQRRARISKMAVRVAAGMTPIVQWTLVKLQPVLKHPARWFGAHARPAGHTGIFEHDDLVALIERQGKQADNRIEATELQRAKQVLALDHQTVAAYLTPRAEVVMVDAADAITPVLVNELHNSGHEYFPVYEGGKTNIVGTLSLSQIADTKQHGGIGANTDHRLAYLSQNATLMQAIRAYQDTRQPLFIIVDQHAKYIGILTIDDVFDFLFGPLGTETPAGYDDPGTASKQDSSQSATEVIE